MPKDYAVPVWITVNANSKAAALKKVVDALCNDAFSWPDKLDVVTADIGAKCDVEEVVDEDDET